MQRGLSVGAVVLLIAMMTQVGLGQGLPTDPRVAESIAQASSENPLPLGQVVDSVYRHQPQIRAALARARQASGERLAAEGGFDPRVIARGERRTGGYYDLLRADVQVRQPTPIWGAELYGGYRYGRSVDPDRLYPSYYEDQTLEDGEVRGGIEIPLWRDGPIDERRATIRATEKLEDAAERAVLATRLQLAVSASSAYYNWVAAGHRLLIGRRLLDLAKQRDVQLQQREQAGSVARFDVTDNIRMVVEREDALIDLRRQFEAASFELSLYLRNADGGSVVADMNRLPALPPVNPDPPLESRKVLSQALQCHPRLAQLRSELQALEVRESLAENQVAPDVRGLFQVSRDLGNVDGDTTLNGTVFQIGMTFGMPLLLRTSRGQAEAASAAVVAKREEVKWLEDQIRASVRNARSRLKAALGRVQVSKRLVATSEALAQGERERFGAGAGTLIIINLREQAAADAANRYINTLSLAHAAQYEWNTLRSIACN